MVPFWHFLNIRKRSEEKQNSCTPPPPHVSSIPGLQWYISLYTSSSSSYFSSSSSSCPFSSARGISLHNAILWRIQHTAAGWRKLGHQQQQRASYKFEMKAAASALLSDNEEMVPFISLSKIRMNSAETGEVAAALTSRFQFHTKVREWKHEELLQVRLFKASRLIQTHLVCLTPAPLNTATQLIPVVG